MVGQRDQDPPGEPDSPHAAGASSRDPAVVAERQRLLAARFATELCDFPPDVWERRPSGSVSSHVAYIEDDPELVTELINVSLGLPSHDESEIPAPPVPWRREDSTS